MCRRARHHVLLRACAGMGGHMRGWEHSFHPVAGCMHMLYSVRRYEYTSVCPVSPSRHGHRCLAPVAFSLVGQLVTRTWTRTRVGASMGGESTPDVSGPGSSVRRRLSLVSLSRLHTKKPQMHPASHDMHARTVAGEPSFPSASVGTSWDGRVTLTQQQCTSGFAWPAVLPAAPRAGPYVMNLLRRWLFAPPPSSDPKRHDASVSKLYRNCRCEIQ